MFVVDEADMIQSNKGFCQALRGRGFFFCLTCESIPSPPPTLHNQLYTIPKSIPQTLHTTVTNYPHLMAAADTDTLTVLLDSTLTFLSDFTTTLLNSNPQTTTSTSPPSSIPTLSLLRDTAHLTRAHTTKLSLLALQTPYPHSATTKVLRELSTSCLLALQTGVHLCLYPSPPPCGRTLAHEVRLRARRLCVELTALLTEIRDVSRGRTVRRGESLKATGVVWEACDELAALAEGGMRGLVAQKGEEWRGLLEDAIEELRAWREGEDTESEGVWDGLLDEEDEAVEGDREGAVEGIFHAANSFPRDGGQWEGLIEEVMGRLKKIILLYRAVEKRRLGIFSCDGDGEAVARLDGIMDGLRRIPQVVDELAGSFYELDVEGVQTQLKLCMIETKDVVEKARLGWDGGEDAFTMWCLKWEEAIG